MADAKRRLYQRAGAEITGNMEAQGAALAVVALEEDHEAMVAAKELKLRGLLVNVVDRPELCDFTTPAIIDRDPVLIAIGTGGASAGLAKALRQRLEQILPGSLGKLADALFAARDNIKGQWPKSIARRRAIDAALDPGGALDPFADGSEAGIADWLSEPDIKPGDAIVTLELSSASPDDLTIKQARLLGQADQIFAESSVPEKIVQRARADAARLDLADFDESKAAGLTLLIKMIK